MTIMPSSLLLKKPINLLLLSTLTVTGPQVVSQVSADTIVECTNIKDIIVNKAIFSYAPLNF